MAGALGILGGLGALGALGIAQVASLIAADPSDAATTTGSAGTLETVGLAREGLVLAFVLMVPVVVAALAASTVVGALSSRLGARDPQLAAIARAAAVVISLLIIGGAIASDLVSFSADLWIRGLAEAGGG